MSNYRPVSPVQRDSRVAEDLRELFVADDEARKIYNMMTMTDKISLPHAMMINLVKDPSIHHRSCMVDWMMREYLSKDCCEIRDTSIRIMDTYLALSYAENPMRLLDNLFLGYVGAASMILSSKLHQSQHPVTAACFGAFNTEELAFFERTMFIKLDTYISPLCTPCAFLPYILKLSSFGHNENLANLAIEIVGDFLESHYSMLFAPSTIAISAVLVSLSYLHLSADTLLSSLPKFMLNTDGYGFFLPEEGKQGYLDTKLCVDMMTRRTFRTRSLTPSPTEVWKNSDVESD